jgi:hypothetical protein
MYTPFKATWGTKEMEEARKVLRSTMDWMSMPDEIPLRHLPGLLLLLSREEVTWQCDLEDHSVEWVLVDALSDDGAADSEDAGSCSTEKEE